MSPTKLALVSKRMFRSIARSLIPSAARAAGSSTARPWWLGSGAATPPLIGSANASAWFSNFSNNRNNANRNGRNKKQSSSTDISNSSSSRISGVLRGQGRIQPRPLIEHDVSVEEMPFLHHGMRPRFRDYIKFKSPRKKASKLRLDLMTEAVQKSKERNPALWQVKFRPGDAIEFEVMEQGGIQNDSRKPDKMRGVVLGKYNRGLDSTVLIRDVVYGEPIERQIPLHSPLIKSLKLLEENFVFKKKKKIKRAKLYYLRDRNPLLTKVSKV